MTNDELKIVRSVLGRKDFGTYSTEILTRIKHINIYSIKLNYKLFRGVFPNWYFIFLRPTNTIFPQEIKNEISREISNVIRLINDSTWEKKPAFIISYNSDYKISEELSFQYDPVFFLDIEEDVLAKSEINNIRNTEFLNTIRRKLQSKELSFLMFEPFQVTDPVIGWRFYGREEEINLLINSNEHFFVIGPRYIGKSSILRETENQLKLRGENVHYVAIQSASDAQQAIGEISRSLSFKEYKKMKRRHEDFDEPFLRSILSTLKGKYGGKYTLILDELGNVIFKNKRDDWEVAGILRQAAQNGEIRVIMSGFQEFFLKQIYEYEGPFVNFARTIKVGGFNNREMRSLIVEPLSIWGRINDEEKLIKVISAKIGRHPRFLQWLAKNIFERLIDFGSYNVDEIAYDILDNEQHIFSETVEQIFFSMGSPVHQFVFLKRCYESDTNGEDILGAIISDEWLKNCLEGINCKSDYKSRMIVFDALLLHGLTENGTNKFEQKVAIPIIYDVLKNSYSDIEYLLAELAKDISKE